MFNDVQKEFDSSIKSLAENSLIKELEKQGIQRDYITNEKFEKLLILKIEIIKSDVKKVGARMAVGIAISLLTE